MWMLYALELVLFIIYNNQKQQTCQGCIETVHLGISWDLHATADLWACSANKTAKCRDVKCVSHFTIVKRSHTVEGPSHAWCESSCQPISNYCVGGSTITSVYFVCFRAQLVQCILCPVSLKLGCKGLCDCSLFRFELGLRNLQLIWCNCLLVIFICFGEAGQAGSSQTWHQTMMNWRLLIQAKTSRSYCRDQAVPYPSIP